MIRKILRFEIKRILISRFIWLLLAIVLLNGFLVQEAVHDYRRLVKDGEDFSSTQIEKVKSYSFISQYGGFGIDLFFLPSPTVILFDDFTNGILVANVNTAERLNLYKPIKGRNFNDAPGLMDLSGIIFIFGSGLFLLYGFCTFRNREYLNVLSSFIGNQN